MRSGIIHAAEAGFAAALLIACRASGGSAGVSDKLFDVKGDGVPDARAAIGHRDRVIEVDDHVGDGVTDARATIQAAIDQAASGTGDVYLPAGTFSISRAGSNFYGLKVPGGVRLHGAGQDKTVLQQVAGTPASVRLLYVTGEGDVVEDLTLDGNKRAQTANAQRHGIFALDAKHLVVRRVTARNFTGDGFYLYKGADSSTFSAVLATSNDRNGITLGGAVDGTQLASSKFIGNKAQQIDSEPGGKDIVSNTKITDCDIDGAGVSSDYVLTCSGTGTATMGHGWSVIGNRINGGILVVWAQDVVIADNVGVNPSSKPSVTVYRSAADVTIRGNRFRQPATGAASVAGVLIQGTSASGPRRVVVAKNQIETDNATSIGVRAAGAESVVVVDNVLRGAGRAAPGNAGIQLRATNPAVDFESAVVRGNRISDFGARGVSVLGNGSARLLLLDIIDNTFENDSVVPSMTEGISLDDGTGAAKQISVIGNKCLGDVKAEVINYPADVPVLVAGVRGAGGIYHIAGSPEGIMAESFGAVAVTRRGRSGATYYFKLSGKDSKTGWVPLMAP